MRRKINSVSAKQSPKRGHLDVSGNPKIVEILNQKIDVENSVILNLCVDPELIEFYSVVLSVDHFTDYTNKKIYKELVNYYHQNNKPLYPFHLKEAREKFLDASVTWRVVADVEQMLIELDLVYKFLLNLNKEIESYNTLTNKPAEFLINLQKKIDESLKLANNNDSSHIFDIAKRFIENRDSINNAFYETKFREIDNYIGGGFSRGDLVLIGGRPRMGKTTFTCQLAVHFAEQNLRVNYYSLEMDKYQILTKIIAYVKDISPARIRLLNDEEILSSVEGFKMRIIDNIFDIDLIEKDIYESNPDVVFVDYIQLVSSKRNNFDTRDRELGQITDHFKYIARKYNCVVIANSQLKRRAEESKEIYPRLSDLRESGGLEATADIVLLLNRPELLGVDTDDKMQSTKGKVYFSIAKNRRGIENVFALVIRNSFMYHIDEKNQINQTYNEVSLF